MTTSGTRRIRQLEKRMAKSNAALKRIVAKLWKDYERYLQQTGDKKQLRELRRHPLPF